jgi:hypothetical protein
VICSASLAPRAGALIFHSTGDPLYNTSAPTGALTGSGWQYQGQWGSFLGTVIASSYFITAKHVGGSVGDSFLFDGRAYTTTAAYHNPANDLSIWRVDGTFDRFAPVLDQAPAVGTTAVILGRGTQRGADVEVGGVLKGWQWGAADGVMRWGENTVATSPAGYLRFKFNADGGPNEVHLAAGDSGGAVFVWDDGVWKLAGLNYAVDGPYRTAPDGPAFNAALFDRGGLYSGSSGVLYPDNPTDDPGYFYATSIAPNLGWISSIAPVVTVPEPQVIWLAAAALALLILRRPMRR